MTEQTYNDTYKFICLNTTLAMTEQTYNDTYKFICLNTTLAMTEQGLTLTRMPKHYPFQVAQKVPCLPPTTTSTTEQESYSCHGHQSKTQQEE